MRRAFILPVLCFFTCVLYSHVNAQSIILDEYVGNEIEFSGHPDVLHPGWRTPKYAGRVRPVDSAEVERSARIIQKAMKKYPPNFVANRMRRIHVVGFLELKGVSINSASYHQDYIIVNRGADNGFTDAVLEQNFHAQVAEQIKYSNSGYFEKIRWTDINKAPYRDLGEDPDLQVYRLALSKDFDDELCKKGILAPWGTAGVDQDWTLFGENLFSCREGFWDIFAKHKRVREKTIEMIKFYNMLDSHFTLEHFQKVSRE